MDINIYEPQITLDMVTSGANQTQTLNQQRAWYELDHVDHETLNSEEKAEFDDIKAHRQRIMDNVIADRKEKEKILGVDPDKIDVFLVCFSVVDRKSYTNALNSWRNIVLWASARNAKVVLMGLKTDLRVDGFFNKIINSHVKEEAARAKATCRRSCWDGYVECEQETNMYHVFHRITDIAFTPKARRLGGCVVI